MHTIRYTALGKGSVTPTPATGRGPQLLHDGLQRREKERARAAQRRSRYIHVPVSLAECERNPVHVASLPQRRGNRARQPGGQVQSLRRKLRGGAVTGPGATVAHAGVHLQVHAVGGG